MIDEGLHKLRQSFIIMVIVLVYVLCFLTRTVDSFHEGVHVHAVIH